MLVLIAAAAAAVTGCSAGQPVAGHGTVASVPRAAPPTTTSSAPSLSAAIRQWEAVAGNHFTESARALEQVSTASGTGDDDAVRAGCALLHDTNSVGLQEHLPTPDPALTAELQRMIDDMNTATHACLRFADGHDSTDAAVYQDYLTRAVEHLQRAKIILEKDLRGR